MDFENYEGTALDSSVFEDEQPDESTNGTQIENTETIDSQNGEESNENTGNVEDVNNGPITYDIDGVGTFTADEIREMKQGNLRQSDYTKKTQELARQREENNDAVQLFEYLKANPELVEVLREADENGNYGAYRYAPTPENAMLEEIRYNQKALETDMKINALKEKYGDIDEVAIFNKAAELRTDDLEFVYKALSYDSNSRESAIAEAKAQLKAELEQNKNAVTSIVSNTANSNHTPTAPLSEQEKRVARNMGISEKEYRKWSLV